MSISHETRACTITAEGYYDDVGYNENDLKAGLKKLFAEEVLVMLTDLNASELTFHQTRASINLQVDGTELEFGLHSMLNVVHGQCDSALLHSGTRENPSSMYIHVYSDERDDWHISQAIVVYDLDGDFSDNFSELVTAWNFGHNTLKEIIDCTI